MAWIILEQLLFIQKVEIKTASNLIQGAINLQETLFRVI